VFNQRLAGVRVRAVLEAQFLPPTS
jgi:hypothetical protein